MLGEEDLNPRGFHLVPPGESLPSMMCPMLIDGGDGSRKVLGSGGSNRIRTALFQTTYRMMFKGSSLEEAVLAPRIHVEGGVVQAESGVSAQGLEQLKNAGLDINQWSTTNLYFGGVHGVVRDANGTLMGQGDPRRGGRHGLAESVTT
jgi:gamma-glutamyltranspeptidase/glutathione hydrolase